MYLLLSIKRTKIVATRHDFWAQNVPKMLLWPRLCPESRCGFGGRFAVGKGDGKRRYRKGKEGRREGKESRGAEGGEEREEERKERRGLA